MPSTRFKLPGRTAKLWTAACLASACAVVPPTHAQSRTRLVIGLGLTHGGDKLASVDYTNGSSVSLYGGGLLVLHGGIEVQATEALSWQLTAGYHISAASASNGDVRFSRYPLNLLAHYAVAPKVRLGGGVEYASSPKFVVNGSLGDVHVGFRASTGPVAELEYLFTPRFGMKLRGALHRYRDDLRRETIDGSYLGLMFNFYLF